MKTVLIVLALILATGFCVSCSGKNHLAPNNSGSSVLGLPALRLSGGDADNGRQKSLPEIESEIESYASPAGVDAGVFEELRGKLLRQIEERKSDRLPSRVPTGRGCKVTDFDLYGNLDVSRHSKLSWRYANVGDYNLDGEVNIADLSEIAVNYGKRQYDKSVIWGDIAYMDFDHSSEIDMGDITAIALNFLSQISGYDVVAAFNPNGPFTAQITVPLEFSDGKVAGGANGWLETGIIGITGAFMALVPYDANGDRGEMSNILTMCSAPSPTPVIKTVYGLHDDTSTYWISGYEGEPGQVQAIVQGSGALSYKWYFGQSATPMYSSDPLPTVEFTDKGVYTNCSLEVTSNYGVAVNYFTVTVHKHANPPSNSIWIDTYDAKPIGGVLFAFYAVKTSEEVACFEIDLSFDKPMTADPQYYSYGSSAYSFAFGPDSVLGGSANANMGISYITGGGKAIGIALCGSAGYSLTGPSLGKFLMAVYLPEVNVKGESPRNFQSNAYWGGDPVNPDLHSFPNWSGRFDWRGNPSLPSRAVSSVVPPYTDVTYLRGAWDAVSGVKLLFRSGLPGDTNGSDGVNSFDVLPVSWRLFQSPNDGVYDDIDAQIDCDGNGEIGVGDITPIGFNFQGDFISFEKYKVLRDGAEIAEVAAPARAPRTKFIKPWDAAEFTDAAATLGSHKYTVQIVYSDGSLGPMSNEVTVDVPAA